MTATCPSRAELERLLADDLDATAEADLARHVESLCQQLCRSYGVDTDRIRLATRIADVSLDLDRAIPRALSIKVYVFEEVFGGLAVWGRIGPGIRIARRKLGSRARQQRRSGNKLRSNANAPAVLLAIDIDAQVINLDAGAPLDQNLSIIGCVGGE